MEEKIYLKEKDYKMPAKKLKPNDICQLNETELEAYLRSIEAIKPWESVEINRDAVVGVPAFIISRVDMAKKPKEDKDRTGTFFNIIQYKFSCDVKNGKLGKNSLANFKTYVKDVYSYSYPAYVLEKLKRTDKVSARAYAAEFKSELQKLYDKKIANDKKEYEKYKAEAMGTSAEARTAIAKIKA